MARTLLLPAEVQFSTRPLVWTAATAEYSGWVDEYYSRPVAQLRVIDPPKYAGFTQKALPEDLPSEIAARVPRSSPFKGFSRKLHKERRPIPLEILISDMPAAEPPLRKVDGWQMRGEFLRLERSTAALLGFLNRYGMWDARRTSPRYRAREPGENWWEWMEPEIVTPNEIWYVQDLREPPDEKTRHRQGSETLLHVQDAIKWGLSCGAARWFKSGYSRAGLNGPRPTFPHFRISAETCSEMLWITITADYLHGTKFRICARRDCGLPFEIQSKHKRNYCTQYCAHLESVRRNRKPRSLQLRAGERSR